MPEDRPTDLKQLAQRLEELAAEGQDLIQWGTNDAIGEWIARLHHELEWADQLVKRLDPERHGEVSIWQPQFRRMSNLATTASRYAGFALALHDKVSAWADIDLLLPPPPASGLFLAEADRPFTAWRHASELLSAAEEAVWAADPYLQDPALELFVNVPASANVRLLGRENSAANPATVHRFAAERGGATEYRVSAHSDMPHDRFLGVDGQVYVSGASFKDIGKRFSVFLRIDDADVSGALIDRFETLWANAERI